MKENNNSLMLLMALKREREMKKKIASHQSQ